MINQEAGCPCGSRCSSAKKHIATSLNANTETRKPNHSYTYTYIRNTRAHAIRARKRVFGNPRGFSCLVPGGVR